MICYTTRFLTEFSAGFVPPDPAKSSLMEGKRDDDSTSSICDSSQGRVKCPRCYFDTAPKSDDFGESQEPICRVHHKRAE